jgi:peptidoglycan hydrolase CwlO-like protein
MIDNGGLTTIKRTLNTLQDNQLKENAQLKNDVIDLMTKLSKLCDDVDLINNKIDEMNDKIKKNSEMIDNILNS